ncbi:MAG: hypothetical protein WD356_00575 [Pseudomonadales bacterium]
MGDRIEELKEKFSTLSELRKTKIEELQRIKGSNNAQFDFAAPVPGTPLSVAEVDSKVAGLCDIASGIAIDTDEILIPQSYFNAFNKPLEQLTTQYQQISDNLANIGSNGGPGTLDADGFSLQSQNGQVNLQLAPMFKNILAHADSVLGALYPLLNLSSSDAFSGLSEMLDTLSTATKQAHEQRAQLAKLSEKARADRSELAELRKQCGPMRDEIERLKTESEKDRKTLSEYSTEGTQSITAIRGTTEQAEQLKTQVDNYSAGFENFQKRLDQREKTIREGSAKQDQLLEAITDIEKKITELNKQAEAMLSGATVAGLAGSFGKLRDDLSGELKWARGVFYFAIFILFLSVVPLAAYVIPGLGEVLSLSSGEAHPQSASATELIGQIVARALLLLPAAWFAKFAAARHAALFRLKEHYAYKYSVASAVEGFKKQAEPYKDEIAATTFYELTFNPAERMDAKSPAEDRHPNPAMEWLMKKVGATHDGKSTK